MSSYADIIKKCEKDWACTTLMTGARASRGSKLPFSSPLMNWATYGGIPRDKITEFFGDYGCGKSTTSVDICKNAIEVFRKEHEEKIVELQQSAASGSKTAKLELSELEERGPKKVFYLDIEHSFDEDWSNTLGINPDDIEVMQPPDIPAEDLLEMVIAIIESMEIGLIVIDSVPSFVTRAELDKKMGERTVASLAGLLTVFCRKVVPLLTRYHVTMIFINQIRDNMDNPYVVKTPGGKALKFYASLRIQFRKGAPVDFLGNELTQQVEDPAGYKIIAKLEKQKSAPFDRKLGSYFLMCKSGINPIFDFAQLALNKYGIIKKGGAWFTLVDPETGEIYEQDGKPMKVNGMAKVYQYLQDNREYYEKIKSYILNDINGVEADAVETDSLFNN